MEFSIVNYKNLEKTSCRFDPEYYHPHNLELMGRLLVVQTKSIGDFSFVTDGIHESIDFDENSTINLISAKAPKENYFDLSDCGYISERQDKKNPRTRLQKNDVIISTVGTIGNCAVVDESVLPANSDRHVGIIRITKGFSPYYLSIFLLSKYGRFQTFRESTGNVQLNLFIYKIKEIIVPELSVNFQSVIECCCLNAKDFIQKSSNLYSQAEQILLTKLNLSNWMPTNQLSFTRNYSDTQAASRIDAEYFQPKYEEVVNELHKYVYGCSTLGNLVKVSDRTFAPSDEFLYKYIELSNISSNGNITGFTEALGKELPTRARQIVNKGNVIISSIEGSLESIALINEPLNNALCSTGFYVVDPTELNPETLLVFLKSVAGQLQLKKGCSGTILTAISKEELLKIVIPKIDGITQDNIKGKIDEMYQSRENSKTLLNIAKRGVEMAIDLDEVQARKWIDEELSKIAQ